MTAHGTPETTGEWLDAIARDIGLVPTPTVKELRMLIQSSYRHAKIDAVALHARLFGQPSKQEE